MESMESINWSDYFSSRMSRSKGSAIRELLSVTAQPGMISFAGGLPAPEAFPLEQIAVATDKLFRERGAAALQYGPTEGYQRLREQIAAQYNAEGVPATPQNILLTSGAQQGLDLIGRVFLDAGDIVAVQAPTYVGALQAWNGLGPHFIQLLVDEHDGTRQGYIPKLSYLIPNFQNPTGMTLTLEQRHNMIRQLHQRGGFLIEDDPYRRLRYSGEDLPGLTAFEAQELGDDWNRCGRVIQLGTFSKTLAPGLRVGWVLAPTAVIQAMVLIKQGLDLHTSSLNQMIISELLADGTLEANLPGLCNLYRQRRDVMLDALEQYLAPIAHWTKPDGGLFTWCTFEHEIDTTAMLGACLDHSVAYVPGYAFFADSQSVQDSHNKRALRLNFSCMAPDVIREGIQRLAHVANTSLAGNRYATVAIHGKTASIRSR